MNAAAPLTVVAEAMVGRVLTRRMGSHAQWAGKACKRAAIFGGLKPALRLPRALPALKQAGLSVVELMVGLTLGLLTVLAASVLVVSNLQLSRSKSDNAQTHEQAALAVVTLSQSIKQAGYGEINREKGYKYENPTNLSAQLPPIMGCDAGFVDAAAGDFACAPLGPGASSNASFTLAQVLSPTLDAAQGLGVDCLGQTVPINPQNGQREVLNHYYVQGGQLFCRATVPDASAAPAGYPYAGRALLSGVVALRLRYGQDTAGTHPSGAWTRSADAAGVTTGAATAGIDALSAWRRVSWAQLCLTVQSTELGSANAAMQYLDCTGQTVTAPDTRLYRTLTERISLRNAL